ncbi:MAG: type II toxin-antitoxin system RelB/DinJ family antitoxin [Ignavibacteria bacterium]
MNHNTIKGSYIQSRMSSDLKERVGIILSELGLNHSDAINLYYRQIVLNNGIPFNLEIPNKTTLKAVKEIESDKTSKSFDSVDELFKDLQE